VSTYVQHLAKAIEAMPLDKLDAFLRPYRAAYASGHMATADYEELETAASSRRTKPAANPASAPQGSPSESVRPRRMHSIFPQKKPRQRPQDRPADIMRRRRLARSSPLPPNLHHYFTDGELAVLRIIGDEFRSKGVCDRSIAEIARRAGVGWTTCRNAIRQANQLGLLAVTARPVVGAKHRTNLIRVVSQEWLTWMRLGPKAKHYGPTPAKPSASPVSLFAQHRVQGSEALGNTYTYSMPSTARECAIG
jgi:hypothetical protein